MKTIEQLREQRAALHAQMTATITPAEEASRALTPEEQTAFEGLRAQFETAGAALDTALTAQNLRFEAGAPATALTTAATQRASLGRHFVNEVGERLSGSTAQGWNVAASEFTNAATDPQVTSGAGLAPLLTEIDRTPVQGLRRRLMIRDLLSTGVLTGNAITYFIEGAVEGGFTTVGQNAQKPQLHFADPAPVTEALKKIAGFIKLSTEMLEDLPFLVSEIDTRLLYELALFEENQILNGNGTGTNVLGLLQRPGIQAMGAVGDPAKDNPDLIFKAMTAVSTATGLDADSIVINPADYQKIRLSKDTAGQYFGGGFFAGQYGNGTIMEQPPLWGLSTVVTPAIAAGTVAVGAFRASTTLYTKGGVKVSGSNSDGNDFTNNRVTVLAEERVALANRKPAATVKLTLGAA